jgi:hypothetical protein
LVRETREMVRREEVIEFAVKYLGDYLREWLEVTKELPDKIYRGEELKNIWVIHVPEFIHIGAGRMICISENDGKVIYDGSDGGE